jgi:hypothetical protein
VRAVALLALPLVLAACGGGEAATVEATRECLLAKRGTAQPAGGVLAAAVQPGSDGPTGGLRAKVPPGGADVLLLFYADDAAARRSADRLDETMASAEQSGYAIPDLGYTIGRRFENVLAIWVDAPTGEQEATVRGCLAP